MADIFSRENDAYGGSFAADGAAITFPQFGNVGVSSGVLPGGAGLLTQQLSAQYSQMITKIYELGTRNCYYIGGRSTGSLSMARIIGPRPIQVEFYRKFGDVCDAATNTIDISVRTGCPTADNGLAVAVPSVYTCRFCVIMSLGLSVAAQDVVINEQLQLMVGSLNLKA